MQKFYGSLTVENIQKVAELILETLENRVYTSTSQNEGFSITSPLFLEVRTDERLENGTNGTPLSVWYSEDGKCAGFNFCDTYGVWGASTNKRTVSGWDSSFNIPYVVITYKEVRIIQRVPAGFKVVWVFSIQE